MVGVLSFTVSQGECPITSSWQSKAGWMPECMDRWFVGMGAQDPMTMRKIYMRQVCAVLSCKIGQN